MTRRVRKALEPRVGLAGFTIMELLVAMALMALLLSFLGQSMGQIILGSDALRGSVMNRRNMVTLRRLFHRDIQNLWDVTTMTMDQGGLEFTTSNCVSTNFPLNVRASWTFSPTVSRREVIEDMGYDKSLDLLEDVESATIEIWLSEEERWIELDAFVMDSASKESYLKQMRALRLTLVIEGSTVTMVERLPHDEVS